LKADVKGTEMNMFQCGARAIALYKPRIATTHYHAGQSVSQVLDFLSLLLPGHNYKFKAIDAKTDNPVIGHFWVNR